jgi:2-polyprenyl-3-methyl-5-hydroxy-6-metoxy-1,4-benzoquinol methylase
MSDHIPKLWERNKPLLQTDFLVRERIIPVLGNIKNLKILDIGCGEGYISRKLARKGAIVEAFDNDLEMINLAKKAGTSNGKINYTVKDLTDIKKSYINKLFDIIIISGVICFLNEEKLLNLLKDVKFLMKPNARIVIATNHADSFLKKANSNWIEYLSKPSISKETQEIKLNFKNHKGINIFSGKCFIHTPEKIISLLRKFGFNLILEQPLLALKKDKMNFSNMWIDEDKIPFHLLIIAKK